MLFRDSSELEAHCSGALAWNEDSVRIRNYEDLRQNCADRLIYNGVFHPEPKIRQLARWLIRSSAEAYGTIPSSIQGLYDAAGKGRYQNRTVPAINIRGMTYDVARAVFRAAKNTETAALIFEIARSEMEYTEQRPEEYAACVIAAGLREGFAHPIFLQGDHFQFNARKYGTDPEKEMAALQDLAAEAIGAGFYNIDIDASTLVDINLPTVPAQQALNSRVSAEMTRYIRSVQPHAITVSIGGEIGEVGKKNSTVQELCAYMDQYVEMLGHGLRGISKISVQTGTTHGGVPLPDGTIAKVNLDFQTLEELSRVARQRYGLSGAVQHGASTLPDEAFDRFPAAGTAEVHLATGFQNMIFESDAFPDDLRREIYEYLTLHHGGEKKADQTEEQFLYGVRKKAFGPFKKTLWDLPSGNRDRIVDAIQGKVQFLFERLNVNNSMDLVHEHVKPVKLPPIPRPV